MLSCNREKCIKNKCWYWNQKERKCYQANLVPCPICMANKMNDVVRTCAEGNLEYNCRICSIYYGADGKIGQFGYYSPLRKFLAWIDVLLFSKQKLGEKSE